MLKKGVKTMSQLIWIGHTEHIDFIRNKLELDGKLLQAEGVVMTIVEENLGAYTFLGVEICGNDPDCPLSEGTMFTLRYSIANLLTDLIIINYETPLLEKVLKSHCYYFSQEEQAFILDKSREILSDLNPGKRRSRVLQTVYEYLETEKVLNIHGFIRFRLKGYLDELSEVVEQAIDEYLMEKEYNDFVRLLKYFVDIQEPKIDRVNVLIQPNGFFQLYDGQDNVIKSDYLESFILELAENELNYEDLLISTLITLAPRQIVLHLPDAGAVGGTVSTVESIFEERVCLCNGCNKCANAKKHQKKP